MRDYNISMNVYKVYLIVISTTGHTRIIKTGLGKQPKQRFIRIISLSRRTTHYCLTQSHIYIFIYTH